MIRIKKGGRIIVDLVIITPETAVWTRMSTGHESVEP